MASSGLIERRVLFQMQSSERELLAVYPTYLNTGYKNYLSPVVLVFAARRSFDYLPYFPSKQSAQSQPQDSLPRLTSLHRKTK